MSHDLEALIWDYRVASTLERLNDARLLLEQALQLAAAQRSDRHTQFAISLEAANFARFVGDLPGGRRHGKSIAELCRDEPFDRYCLHWHHVRQETLSNRAAEAAAFSFEMLEAVGETVDVPARQAAAMAEVAGLQCALGKPAQGIALYDAACELLMQVGTHPQWAGLYLFQQSRALISMARTCDERALGQLGDVDSMRFFNGRAFWRRAADSLALATEQLSRGSADGLLARSVAALQSTVAGNTSDGDQTLRNMCELMRHYEEHRMIDPLVWSSCEVARLLMDRDDPEEAHKGLAAARALVPNEGYSSLRESLDFCDSLVQRKRGDHRRALQSYQRYAQRASARTANVPAALADGTLSRRARLLGTSTEKRFVHGRTRLPGRREATHPHTGPVSRQDRSVLASSAGLTEREVEIMDMVEDGMSNRQIGALLTLSSHTVRNHLAAVFRKLKVNTRAQATQRIAACAAALAASPEVHSEGLRS